MVAHNIGVKSHTAMAYTYLRATLESLLLAVFCCSGVFSTSAMAQGVSWVSPVNGAIPAGAVVAGQEPNGAPLFACHASYQGGVQPGKVVANNCNIGYGGAEIRVPTYQVAVGSVSWVNAANGQIPANAVVAGTESNGRPLALCHANFAGGVHAGKVVGSNCNFGYGGKEVLVSQYQVAIPGATQTPTASVTPTTTAAPTPTAMPTPASAAKISIVNVYSSTFKRFVAAEDNGVTVNANRPAAGPWEKWDMARTGNTVSFKSWKGLYLSAQPDGSVQANRTAVGPWEQFTVVDAGGGLLAFKTAHNTFLGTEPGGAFFARANAQNTWERFQVLDLAVKQATDAATLAAMKLANAHVNAAARIMDARYSANQVNIAKADAAAIKARNAAIAAVGPINWVNASNGQTVAGAERAGREGGSFNQAACRAMYNGGNIPGTVIGNGCSIAVSGGVAQVPNYQVAVGSLGWMEASNGASVPSALPAGTGIPTVNWSAMPGGAGLDIGAGGSGQVWLTTVNKAIFRLVNGKWAQQPGAAARVAVARSGDAWVVNDGGGIYQWINGGWQQKPGALSDIAVGADGTVWGVNSGGLIYRWNGGGWEQKPGAATRITVDPNGNAWVVNAGNVIYTWTGNGWVERPGRALDIAACGNGSVYVVGTDSRPYAWYGGTWVQLPGSNLKNIACDQNGQIYATLNNQGIATATAPDDRLALCRGLVPGGAVRVGHLRATGCAVANGGSEAVLATYQVAIDHGANAGRQHQFMVTAADTSLNKATAIDAKVAAAAAAAQADAAKAAQEYKDAVARAAIAQKAAGMDPDSPVPTGQINYVAMVSGSANLGGGVTAAGGARVDYGVTGQITSTGVAGTYSFVAQAGGAVTYGNADYNTTISGLVKYEETYSGCAGVVDKTACLQASAKNMASAQAGLQSNVALGGGTTLTSGATGTVSVGYYGDAGFAAGPGANGVTGALQGGIGATATAEVNYGVYNDGYGGAGAKAGVSAGGLSGGGKGSATYTDGTLKIEACGTVEIGIGVDLCIDGQVNLGAAYNALSPTVMQGANYLVEVTPGVYRTSATAVQDAGVTVYRGGEVAVSTLAQVSTSAVSTVGAGSVAAANRIAQGTVNALYTAGGISAGAANQVVKTGQIAADVVASNAARAAVVADFTKSAANTVAGGFMTAANTVADGVMSAANTVGNGVVSVANTVGGGITSVANTVGNGIASVFSGW